VAEDFGHFEAAANSRAHVSRLRSSEIGPRPPFGGWGIGKDPLRFADIGSFPERAVPRYPTPGLRAARPFSGIPGSRYRERFKEASPGFHGDGKDRYINDNGTNQMRGNGHDDGRTVDAEIATYRLAAERTLVQLEWSSTTCVASANEASPKRLTRTGDSSSGR
jgi:hypothetical protein